MQPISPALDIKSLAFSSALTFEEFLAISPVYNDLFRQRVAEVRLPAAGQHYFSSYPDTLYFIVLVSPDDPDTVAVLPILHMIATVSARIEMRILCDEDDLTRLDQLVDDLDLSGDLDELDLPLLVVLDETWNYQGRWGPRPTAANRYLDQWLEANPDYERLADEDGDEVQDAYAARLDMLTYEMRVWYNTSLNLACVSEIRTLLANLQTEPPNGNETTDS